jgi:hypothetical protein
MEKILFYAISFLGGILFWSLRSLLLEKTMKRRASDQYVSLGELDLYCRRRHDTDKTMRELEIGHLKELLGKDLTSNTNRLEKLEAMVSDQSKTLSNVNENLIKLIDAKA